MGMALILRLAKGTFFSAVAITVLCFSDGAWADHYNEGDSAYRRGDRAMAASAWMQGAEEGDPKSQYALALMYERGEGVPRDDVEAIKWYRQAAENGHAAAQNNLGIMYAEGRGGVAKDEREAVKWYYRAAKQGSLEGISSLARAYEKGRGVPQDYNTAAITYLEAAKRGYAPAQVNVGLLYAANVPGVPLDYRLAYKWTSLAIPNLSSDRRYRLVKARETIAAHLTAEERAKIDEDVRAWRPVTRAPARPEFGP